MPENDIWFVVTADQIGSRKRPDAVPQTLTALTPYGRGKQGRAFVRTAGDEIQGLLRDPEQLLDVVETLTRAGGWRIGVGVGPVAHPIPRDVRAATGPAFFAARTAVTTARLAPQQLRVVAESEGADDATAAADLEAALTLLLTVWKRRREAGWEVAELLADGRPASEVAQQLGITASAVSQRIRSAHIDEADAGRRLAVHLAHRAQHRDVSAPAPAEKIAESTD